VHAAKAQEACGLVKGESMYEEFESFLGVTPPDDTAGCPAKGEEGHEACLEKRGGDARLDIYLVHYAMIAGHIGARAGGFCSPDFDTGEELTAFVVVDRGLSGSQLGSALAHELFHAFQFSIDADEERWWIESTAVWASHYINDTWNQEQRFLSYAFDDKDNSLTSVTKADGDHEYGIYLFPLYLHQRHEAELIASIWKKCVLKEASQIVASTVPGGWDGAMKEFAMWCLDRGEYEGRFKDAGGPLELYDKHDDREWSIKEEDKIEEPEIELELEPLSARYILAKNHLTDPDVVSVRFRLDEFKENDKLTVQAIILDQATLKDLKYEDWSDLETRQFCLNREEDQFAGIWITVASSDPAQAHKAKLKVETSPDCWEWEGTFTYNQTINQSWDCGSNGRQGSVSIATSARFNLAFLAPELPEGIPRPSPVKYVDPAPVSAYRIAYDYHDEDNDVDAHQDCAGSFYPTSWRMYVDYEEGTYDLYDFHFYLKDGTCGHLGRDFLEFSDSFYLGDAGFQPIAKGKTDGQSITGSWSSPISCGSMEDWCGYDGGTPRSCGITASWSFRRLVEEDKPDE
jgi:hypothetical protein